VLKVLQKKRTICAQFAQPKLSALSLDCRRQSINKHAQQQPLVVIFLLSPLPASRLELGAWSLESSN